MSMFDFDDSINIAFNAKTAGKNLVTAKHEVLSKTGEFLFLAHSDREFALRCQMVEKDIESAALRKMANISDSKAKLVRALHEEWKLRHANCKMCKVAKGDQEKCAECGKPATHKDVHGYLELCDDCVKTKKGSTENFKLLREEKGASKTANPAMEQQILHELQEVEEMLKCQCGAECKGRFNGAAQCAPGEGCCINATAGTCGSCGQSFQGHNVCAEGAGCSAGGEGSLGGATASIRTAMAYYDKGKAPVKSNMYGSPSARSFHDAYAGLAETRDEAGNITDGLGLHRPEVRALAKGGDPVLVLNTPIRGGRLSQFEQSTPDVRIGFLHGHPDGPPVLSPKVCNGDSIMGHPGCNCSQRGLGPQQHGLVSVVSTDWDSDTGMPSLKPNHEEAVTEVPLHHIIALPSFLDDHPEHPLAPIRASILASARRNLSGLWTPPGANQPVAGWHRETENPATNMIGGVFRMKPLSSKTRPDPFDMGTMVVTGTTVGGANLSRRFSDLEKTGTDAAGFRERYTRGTNPDGSARMINENEPGIVGYVLRGGNKSMGNTDAAALSRAFFSGTTPSGGSAFSDARIMPRTLSMRDLGERLGNVDFGATDAADRIVGELRRGRGSSSSTTPSTTPPVPSAVNLNSVSGLIPSTRTEMHFGEEGHAGEAPRAEF